MYYAYRTRDINIVKLVAENSIDAWKNNSYCMEYVCMENTDLNFIKFIV